MIIVINKPLQYCVSSLYSKTLVRERGFGNINSRNVLNSLLKNAKIERSIIKSTSFSFVIISRSNLEIFQKFLIPTAMFAILWAYPEAKSKQAQ
jgi:hypothetical protein